MWSWALRSSQTHLRLQQVLAVRNSPSLGQKMQISVSLKENWRFSDNAHMATALQTQEELTTWLLWFTKPFPPDGCQGRIDESIAIELNLFTIGHLVTSNERAPDLKCTTSNLTIFFNNTQKWWISSNIQHVFSGFCVRSKLSDIDSWNFRLLKETGKQISCYFPE